MHKVRVIIVVVYTGRSSENICDSSSRGTANVMPLFAGSFYNLEQFWTKLRVLVLCFPDFTENSNIHEERTAIIEC